MPRNREEADLFFCSVTSLQKCETRTKVALLCDKSRCRAFFVCSTLLGQGGSNWVMVLIFGHNFFQT